MWDILKILDWYEHFYLSFRILKDTNFSVDVYVRLAVGGLKVTCPPLQATAQTIFLNNHYLFLT